VTWTLRAAGLADLSLIPDEGYAVLGYDLGFPEIRAVTDLNADGDGETDLTQYFGARVVTLEVRVTGTAVERQNRVMTLRRYMAPNLRVELLWDAAYGSVRMLGRADRFAAVVGEAMTRQVARVGWRVASGLIESQTVTQTVILPGAGAVTGRVYDLEFDRVYPAGSTPGQALINVGGTAPVWPLLRLYGPCTLPDVQIVTSGARWRFAAGGVLTLLAGDWVDIDTYARTVKLNSVTSILQYVAPSTLAWGGFSPGVCDVQFLVTSGGSETTRLEVFHRDSWY